MYFLRITLTFFKSIFLDLETLAESINLFFREQHRSERKISCTFTFGRLKVCFCDLIRNLSFTTGLSSFSCRVKLVQKYDVYRIRAATRIWDYFILLKCSIIKCSLTRFCKKIYTTLIEPDQTFNAV